MLRVNRYIISSAAARLKQSTNTASSCSTSWRRLHVNHVSVSAASSSLAMSRNGIRNVRDSNALRALSSSSSSNNNNKKEYQDPNTDGSERQDLVLTPGQKVVAGTRLTLFAGAALFASFCAYYIGRELFPTKMSPNTIFGRASDAIKNHPEVQRRFGDNVKTYGRDHGGHREGRRNFIEHTEYTDQDDGSKRMRVRFNLEGKFANAFVFCEVSNDMPDNADLSHGDFVYLMVQDKRNGRVITIVDNRSRIMAKRMAGGSAAGQQAFGNLLGGGKK